MYKPVDVLFATEFHVQGRRQCVSVLMYNPGVVLYTSAFNVQVGIRAFFAAEINVLTSSRAYVSAFNVQGSRCAYRFRL